MSNIMPPPTPEEIEANGLDKPLVETPPSGDFLDIIHQKTEEEESLWHTGAEIATMVPPEIDWFVYPLAAPGVVTLFYGSPKDGKSTYIYEGLSAMMRGLPVLGETSNKTHTVILTEEKPSSLRRTLENTGLDSDASVISYGMFIRLFKLSWEEVLQETALEIRRTGARLLIVDTMARFARFAGDAENNSGEVISAYDKLERLQVKFPELGIVILHHSSKFSGKDRGVIDSIRGSSAIAGVVDTICRIRRLPKEPIASTKRLLETVSRFEVEDTIAIDLTDRGYTRIDMTKKGA